MAGDHRNLRDWGKMLEKVPVNTPVRFLVAGDAVRSGRIRFKTLSPKDPTVLSVDPNHGSLVLLVTRGKFRSLFTGDASWPLVAETLSGIGKLDLLKIPHHGSATGFLASGMEEAIDSMGSDGLTRFLCPSPAPGKGKLPSMKVVNWFSSRGIQLLYPEYPGLTLRYRDHRENELHKMKLYFSYPFVKQ
jgi:hypothetical protein